MASLTERTALLGKVAELDLEPDTDTVGVGSGCDGALDVAAVGVGSLVEGGVREGGRINDTGGVADDNSRVTEILLTWSVAAMPARYTRRDVSCGTYASLDGLRQNGRNGSCREQ